MRLTKKNWIVIIGIILVIVALYFVLKILFIPLVTSSQFKEFIADIGIWGYAVLVGIIMFTQVFAPIPGTPVVLLSISLYGVGTSMILAYVSSIISYAINFYIARKFGRKWVIKFVGEKSMKEVDEFTTLEGNKALIICRLLGFSLSEIISYAVGLTKMPFKNYIIITIVTTAITRFLSYLLFINIDFGSEKGIIIWLLFVYGAALVFGILVKSYLNKRKQKGDT
jgi:uncharacterized membrane protein YdjX (TVP38/TMEM64 family)